MPTQGVGFLTRKINHRGIGVKGLLKKFRGYGYLAFHFRNRKMVAIGNWSNEPKIETTNRIA